MIEPYMNGTKFIDPFKYPTLNRAQRVIRANNVKAREIEARTKSNHFDSKRLEITKAIDKAIEDNRLESMDEHLMELDEWDRHFEGITYEEDQRRLREEQARVAEQLRKEKEAAAELRERELAIWTANEKARLDRFVAEQAALQRQEAERVALLLEQREKDIHALSKHHVGGQYDARNQHLFVNVHGLYVRKLPTKASRMVDNLSQNSWITVNGWIAHEELFGNPIWFRLANGQGWIWSGGVHTQATTGLENLNYLKAEGDSFVTKSADGMVCQEWTAPSELQQMVDKEIADLKREKQALEGTKTTNYYQSSKPTAPIPVGSMWFDTADGNQSYSWDGHVWLPTFSANKDTLGTVYPQLSTARIEPSKTFTTEDIANLVSRDSFPSTNRGKASDFWRGTSFESK
jgi:hypothetical protein